MVSSDILSGDLSLFIFIVLADVFVFASYSLLGTSSLPVFFFFSLLSLALFFLLFMVITGLILNLFSSTFFKLYI